MLRGKRVRGRSAPVVAYHEDLLLAEDVVHEAPDIVRERLLVVAGERPRRIAEAAQVTSPQSTRTTPFTRRLIDSVTQGRAPASDR